MLSLATFLGQVFSEYVLVISFKSVLTLEIRSQGCSCSLPNYRAFGEISLFCLFVRCLSLPK